MVERILRLCISHLLQSFNHYPHHSSVCTRTTRLSRADVRSCAYVRVCVGEVSVVLRRVLAATTSLTYTSLVSDRGEVSGSALV